MFRIVDGKIAEHWDPATKPAAPARPTGGPGLTGE
jgi:predicted SnoaL-like aldol condensation-catalyzing enzyme